MRQKVRYRKRVSRATEKDPTPVRFLHLSTIEIRPTDQRLKIGSKVANISDLSTAVERNVMTTAIEIKSFEIRGGEAATAA
jgi:hypothetical protein